MLRTLLFAWFMSACAAYPTTFGGKVYSGPNRNYPVNVCYYFSRPNTFTECDGAKSADHYCRERGYSSAETFSKESIVNVGSSFVLGNSKIVEAGLSPTQQLLSDVTCV